MLVADSPTLPVIEGIPHCHLGGVLPGLPEQVFESMAEPASRAPTCSSAGGQNVPGSRKSSLLEAGAQSSVPVLFPTLFLLPSENKPGSL